MDILNRLVLLEKKQISSHIQTERQREAYISKKQNKIRLIQNLQTLDHQLKEYQTRLLKLPIETEQKHSELRTCLMVLMQQKTKLLSQGE